MTWTDPAAAVALFETGDVFGASNFNSYVLQNLLSMPHPLEAPTTSALDVVSTVAETTLYSVTVPGNAMGANGSVEMFLMGDYLHNNVAGDTLRFRFKFGGVTWYSSITDFGTSLGANRQPWKLELAMMNVGATNVQRGYGTVQYFSANVTAPTIGIGNVTVDTFQPLGMGSAAGTVDTTVNQTLLVSVEWSASSANNSFARRWARTLIAQN